MAQAFADNSRSVKPELTRGRRCQRRAADVGNVRHAPRAQALAQPAIGGGPRMGPEERGAGVIGPQENEIRSGALARIQFGQSTAPWVWAIDNSLHSGQPSWSWLASSSAALSQCLAGEPVVATSGPG